MNDSPDTIVHAPHRRSPSTMTAKKTAATGSASSSTRPLPIMTASKTSSVSAPARPIAARRWNAPVCYPACACSMSAWIPDWSLNRARTFWAMPAASPALTQSGMIRNAKLPAGVTVVEGRAEQIPLADWIMISQHGLALRHVSDMAVASPNSTGCSSRRQGVHPRITPPKGKIATALLKAYCKYAGADAANCCQRQEHRSCAILPLAGDFEECTPCRPA